MDRHPSQFSCHAPPVKPLHQSGGAKPGGVSPSGSIAWSAPRKTGSPPPRGSPVRDPPASLVWTGALHAFRRQVFPIPVSGGERLSLPVGDSGIHLHSAKQPARGFMVEPTTTPTAIAPPFPGHIRFFRCPRLSSSIGPRVRSSYASRRVLPPRPRPLGPPRRLPSFSACVHPGKPSFGRKPLRFIDRLAHSKQMGLATLQAPATARLSPRISSRRAPCCLARIVSSCRVSGPGFRAVLPVGAPVGRQTS